jgi:hypothetical protein
MSVWSIDGKERGIFIKYPIVIDRIEGSKSLVKIVSETEMPFEKW